MTDNHPGHSSWRSKIYEVIFEADTGPGRAFDVILLWAIVISVIAVLLESVDSIRAEYGFSLKFIEWVFTILFTLEYLVRIFCVKKPSRYVFSFFGLVDLLAVLPGYLSLVFVGSHSLLVIRGLRLLRIFRIFKLGRYTGEAGTLLKALSASKAKITVFLGAVMTIVLIMGAVMYLIEGADSGFTSIPRVIYWAIVTMTTVGYGDLVPTTSLGQFIAAIIMICGYGIIAVPTGIVSVELANAQRMDLKSTLCSGCKKKEHPLDAKYCMICGTKL